MSLIKSKEILTLKLTQKTKEQREGYSDSFSCFTKATQYNETCVAYKNKDIILILERSICLLIKIVKDSRFTLGILYIDSTYFLVILKFETN